MTFPAAKTNAIDGPPGIGTEIVAAIINNLETKVGVDNDSETSSLDYMVRHHEDHSEIHLTPKASSGGPEGTIFYASDDDHVYVATE